MLQFNGDVFGLLITTIEFLARNWPIKSLEDKNKKEKREKKANDALTHCYGDVNFGPL